MSQDIRGTDHLKDSVVFSAWGVPISIRTKPCSRLFLVCSKHLPPNAGTYVSRTKAVLHAPCGHDDASFVASS